MFYIPNDTTHKNPKFVIEPMIVPIDRSYVSHPSVQIMTSILMSLVDHTKLEKIINREEVRASMLKYQESKVSQVATIFMRTNNHRTVFDWVYIAVINLSHHVTDIIAHTRAPSIKKWTDQKILQSAYAMSM